MKYAYVNQFGVPDIFMSVLVNKERRSFIKDAFASASQLSGPAYSWALYKTLSQQGHEITIDVSNLWASALGKAAHTYLESALMDDVNMVQKTTFQAVYDDTYLVTGEPDVYDKSTGALYDLKTATVNKPIDENSIKSWEYQVNIYASLLRKNGYYPKKASIIVAYKDWSKIRAANDPKYPKAPIVEVELKLWSEEHADNWVLSRCKEFENTFNSMAYGNIHECSKEERWEKAPSYVVKKIGAKKASKKLDSEEASKEWIQSQKKPGEYIIEYRPAERTRCKYFCDIASECQSWQKVNTDDSEDEE